MFGASLFGVGLNDLPQIIQSTQMCLHDILVFILLSGQLLKD